MISVQLKANLTLSLLARLTQSLPQSNAVLPKERPSPQEDDVDVEQCSDNESSSQNDSARKSSKSPQMMPPKKKAKKGKRMESSCNCEELKYVECILETKDLWDKFHDLETEMIITKTGR